ncbi:MAG TPA: uracil-DNA glycosylase [Thermoanaerobaculia bacterium]|nr:uracil-DNA glycosylase [Thermoanaerobaculia bacterium]
MSADLDPRAARAALEYFADLGYEELVMRPPTPRDDDAAERRARLGALRDQALVCTACALAGTRTQVVFGTGDPDADLMFVGEGPGYHEDQQGEPFVGAAGALLDKIIGAIGLERRQVYIANVVKCRPPNNRDPHPDEVAACSGFLREQILLVRPRVIVALGRVAAQNLLASSAPIGRLRGRWHDFEGVPLRVTYHPAALLRNGSLKRPTWEDMQTVRDHLAAPAAPGPP